MSLVFSKYWSKTTRRQNSQNKDNRTNWGPEFFVIYWPKRFVICYRVLLYFVKFSQVLVVWKVFVTNKKLTFKRIFNFKKIFCLFCIFQFYTTQLSWILCEKGACVFIIYQILQTYFFCFSFCNWYYLEKNFALLNV